MSKCIIWLAATMTTLSVFSMSENRSEDRVVVLGTIQRMIVERDRQGATKNQGNELIVSNSCGRYEVHINIDEIIIGDFSEKYIVAGGPLSEWCETDLKFNPKHNVFNMKRRKGGYYIEDHIPLYATEKEGLAALPEWAEILGDVRLIREIDFLPNQLEVFIKPEIASKLPKEWFKEHKDAFIYKAGIPYQSVRLILIKQDELSKPE